MAPSGGSFVTVAGATDRVWTGADRNSAAEITSFMEGIPGITAVFSWNNPAQQFEYWFKGFPPEFQTLTHMWRGLDHFFQSPGGVTVPLS